MEYQNTDNNMRLPACPRDGATWIQIIDWTRPLLEEAMERAHADAAFMKMIPAEVLYVCHSCDKTFGHPVPDAWTPPAGWLPVYA